MIILYTDLLLPEKSNAIVIFELKPSPSPIQGHTLFTVGISGQKLRFSDCWHMIHGFTDKLAYFYQLHRMQFYFWAKIFTKPNTGPHLFTAGIFGQNVKFSNCRYMRHVFTINWREVSEEQWRREGRGPGIDCSQLRVVGRHEGWRGRNKWMEGGWRVQSVVSELVR